MSLSNQPPFRDDATGNGSVADFTFTLPIYTKNDLTVLKAGATQTLDTHYQVLEPGGLPFATLAAASLPSTGKIRFIDGDGDPDPPASGVAIAILRNQPLQQTSEYTANEAFPAVRIEKDYDKLTMLVQQLREIIGRCFKTTARTPTQDLDFPDPTVSANQGKVLRISADGTAIEALAVQTTDFANPITTEGDLVQGGTGGVAERLPIGTEGQLPAVASGKLAYLSQGAGGGLDADKLDGLHAADVWSLTPPSRIDFFDDFMSIGIIGGNGTGFGQGWSVRLGSGATVVGEENEIPTLTPDAARPGQVRLLTPDTIGIRASIHLALLHPDTTFDLLMAATGPDAEGGNTAMKVGLGEHNNQDGDADFIGFEKLSADTNWFVVTRASSTATRTDAGFVADGTYHAFRVRRKDAATIAFSVDGGTEIEHTTNIPSATDLKPGFTQVSIAAGAGSRVCFIDFARLTITGLAR